jgi:hypothetical protein
MLKLKEKNEIDGISQTSAFAGVLYIKFIFAFKLIIGAMGGEHWVSVCC